MYKDNYKIMGAHRLEGLVERVSRNANAKEFMKRLSSKFTEDLLHTRVVVGLITDTVGAGTI